MAKVLAGTTEYAGAETAPKLSGAATCWDDLDFAITIRTGGGENPPVWTLSAGASCLLSGFDMHGEIDSFGSDQEYVK